MKEKKETVYKLDISVVVRIVNILQEAMLTGTDISALLCDVELRPEKGTLVMTDRYVENVERELKKMEEHMAQLKSELTKDLKVN